MRTSSAHDWLVFLGGAFLIAILAKILKRARRAQSSSTRKTIDPQR